MTVRDLIAYLQTVDPDLDVAYMACSDAQHLHADEIQVIHGIDHGSGSYIERHTGPRWVPYPDDKRKPYLLFPGN